MTDCPKQACVQDSRIRTLEVRQDRLCKDVKEIHAEVVGVNGDGIKTRIKLLEVTLLNRDRRAERFWKIFGCAVAVLAVIVALVK